MAIQDELPKSRITLTYRTTINGEPETVKLPLRLLILGDFSLGTSADRREKDENGKDKKNEAGDLKEIDLEARRMRTLNGRNLDDVMKDMKMSLKLDSITNFIDESGPLPVELPITRMKSFHPDEIVQHVPKLKALLLLRKLLAEMQSSIDNRKDLRNAIYKLFEDEAQRKAIADELAATHKSLKLPAGKAPDAPVTPTT
ncbi:type VI secretion system contractile sheath small subunit [Hyalangium rubrum]|uniref:Type VI secretion system contractile sheath small subunit n=1 Tax=Hyalangium rubrum TaxID=3103134 RepID=A0ABU5HJS2_9BACT|nr:type VI secretion system contractile sheath small subunit [Hyalangium sp. s54d21]MDY7233067.1 type VI secretion system contractile sheath small subunit [Hyalangium sp. s54d21]